MSIQKFGYTELAAQLRQEIITGKLAHQQRLPPERVLEKQYDVARGTVRNALNMLAEEGLLDVKRGSGSYVNHSKKPEDSYVIENATPLELIDARFALEPHICRLAILHGKRLDFEKAERQLDIMEQSQHDPRAFSLADTEFHTILAQSTGNSLLIWAINQINNVRLQDEWAKMRQLTLHPESISIYNREHRAILNAIKSRSPEEAAKLMKNHLGGARVSLNKALST